MIVMLLGCAIEHQVVGDAPSFHWLAAKPVCKPDFSGSFLDPTTPFFLHFQPFTLRRLDTLVHLIQTSTLAD
jgi:hypothetical protein